MSRYGHYEKGQIYESIKDFIISQKKSDERMSDIIKDVMEAVSDGLENGIYEALDETNNKQ